MNVATVLYYSVLFIVSLGLFVLGVWATLTAVLGSLDLGGSEGRTEDRPGGRRLGRQKPRPTPETERLRSPGKTNEDWGC